MPRRANPQPPGDLDRPVEVAPALGPVVRDLSGPDLDQRAARSGLEVRQRRQLARRSVDRVLDDVAEIDLLDTGGRQLQQLRQRELRVLAADTQREPDQDSRRRSLPTSVSDSPN